jgi:hypothetical protein
MALKHASLFSPICCFFDFMASVIFRSGMITLKGKKMNAFISIRNGSTIRTAGGGKTNEEF